MFHYRSQLRLSGCCCRPRVWRLETIWILFGNHPKKPAEVETFCKLPGNLLETLMLFRQLPVIAAPLRSPRARGGETAYQLNYFSSERAAPIVRRRWLSRGNRQLKAFAWREAHLWGQPAQARSPPATMTPGSTFMAKPRFFQYDRTTDRQILVA